MIFNKFCNRFINKITNILILLIFILFAFFIGLNSAHAIEVEPFLGSDDSPYDSMPTLNSISFSSTYEYSDYDSEEIMQLVFDISNETYFDNTLTIDEFYSNFTYVVNSFSSTSIRVFVQDYSLMLENQGLERINGSKTKFYFYNVGIKTEEVIYDCPEDCWDENCCVSTSQNVYLNGFGYYYNWYISIDLSNNSSSVEDEGNRLNLKPYGFGRRSVVDPVSRTFNNIPLFDSYNGNFGWIESWNPLVGPNIEAGDVYFLIGLWPEANWPYDESTGTYYYFNIFDIPDLEYVADDSESGGGESGGGESGGGESGGGESEVPPDVWEKFYDWLSKIESNTNSSSNILSDILDNTIDIFDSIGEGLNDVISGISDTLNDLFSSVTDFFGDFFDNLINALISLVVPDNFDKAEELYENIKSKLGFIVEVPELIITFMFDLINADWEKVTSLTFPSIDIFGYNFWSEKEIDLMPILNIIQPYKIYTDIACVGLMIMGCINLYDKFTGGDS